MKQRITVTIDSDSYQLLKSADVNISGLVNTAMQNEARRLRAERWQAPGCCRIRSPVSSIRWCTSGTRAGA